MPFGNRKEKLEEKLNLEREVTHVVWEESDQKAWAVKFVMMEIWKAGPKFEGPYLEPFMVKRDIIPLIREEEDKVAKKAAD